jgi:cell division transport system permease protein
MIRRTVYFVRQALSSLKSSPGMSLLTCSTIGVALLFFGGTTAAMGNFENVLLSWGRHATVAVYIDDGESESQLRDLEKSLKSLPPVADVTRITPEQALGRFRAQGAQAALLVEGMDANLLPTSYELRLHAAHQTLADIQTLADRIAALPGVSDVDFGQEELTELGSIVRVLRIGGWLMGFALFWATAMIVSNTIRLTVYARRDEIDILQLVGATDGFIRAPFLIEGGLWGLGGALLAAMCLWVVDKWLLVDIGTALTVSSGMSLRLMHTEIFAMLLVVGTLLGVAASFLALRPLFHATQEQT